MFIHNTGGYIARIQSLVPELMSAGCRGFWGTRGWNWVYWGEGGGGGISDANFAKNWQSIGLIVGTRDKKLYCYKSLTPRPRVPHRLPSHTHTPHPHTLPQHLHPPLKHPLPSVTLKIMCLRKSSQNNYTAVSTSQSPILLLS